MRVFALLLLTACGYPDEKPAADDTGCVPVTRWADADGDGFGDPDAAGTACAAEGWVLDATDCAPDDATTHPGAEDVCGDGVDADCSGRDAVCGVEGEHSLDEAIKLTSSRAGAQSAGQVRVGDVDDDGIGDLVVATLYADSGGAYVVPGPIVGDVALDTDAFYISGSSQAYGTGRSVALGDLDGDGITDVALGAPYSGAGLYVVTGPVTGDVALETEADIVLLGPQDSYAGHGSELADVNGDGFDDAIVSAYGVDRFRGAVYVAYGPLAPGEHDLATTADVTLVGEVEGSYTGRWVRAGGDVNGDGVGDMLVPAPFGAFNGPQTGAVYVVYGPGDAYSDLADADGRILGVDPNTSAGVEIGMGGDLDGDGLADIAAQTYDRTAGESAGAAHVVFGPAAGERYVADADITVLGTGGGQFAGSAFAIADRDGDGTAELVLGAYGDATAGAEAGAVYYFYAPSAGRYAITEADAWFLGQAAGDRAGTALTTGDLDADGHDELVVGAPFESSGATSGGAAYVLVD
ncbi:MAG: FG-GAP repeat protein [Myxococcota bacterium]